jgi:hypothetical protein
MYIYIFLKKNWAFIYWTESYQWSIECVLDNAMLSNAKKIGLINMEKKPFADDV